MMSPISSTARKVLQRVALFGVLSCLLFTGSAFADPLTGASVSQSFVSGFSFFNTMPTGAQTIPTGYTIGLSGFPIQDMNISTTGLISFTPNGQSCSSGCGWNFSGATYQFTFTGAPKITGLTITQNDLNNGVNLIDDHTFQVVVNSGSGFTNRNFTYAQLQFAPAVPEPGSMLLFATGLGSLVRLRRRFRR